MLKNVKSEGNVPIDFDQENLNLACFVKDPSPQSGVYFQFVSSNVEDLIFHVRRIFDYPSHLAGTSSTFSLARIEDRFRVA